MNSIGPAGRLLRLLQEAGRRASPENNQRPAIEVWSEIVSGGRPVDRALGVAAFASVMALVVETKALIRAHPDALKQDLYMGALNDVEGALLSQHLGGQWGSFPQQLTGPIMRSLEFCADALDRLSPESEVQTEELDRLRSDIDGIVQRIVESDLEADLKTLLIARLEDMRAAILRYRVTGVAPIESASHAAIGTAVVVSQQTTSPGSKAVIREYLELAGKGMDVAEKARRIAPMIANAVTKVAGLLAGG